MGMSSQKLPQNDTAATTDDIHVAPSSNIPDLAAKQRRPLFANASGAFSIGWKVALVVLVLFVVISVSDAVQDYCYQQGLQESYAKLEAAEILSEKAYEQVKAAHPADPYSSGNAPIGGGMNIESILAYQNP